MDNDEVDLHESFSKHYYPHGKKWRSRDICDSDYIFPDICLDCGRCQGSFPKENIEELEGETYEDFD